MKRPIIAMVILFGSVLAAHADRNIWTDVTKQGRGDTAVTQDACRCAEIWGPDLDGVPTSREFKRCMRSHGWRFDGTLVSWHHHHRHYHSW